jgi:hypothetical protein
MITLTPVALEGHGVRLEPLEMSHAGGLIAAAADGRLWELWYSFIPRPDETAGYITGALAGHLKPWAAGWSVSGRTASTSRPSARSKRLARHARDQ